MTRFRSLDLFGEPAGPVPGEQYFPAQSRGCGCGLHGGRLVKGEGFAIDASVMEANASRYHGKAPDEIDWAVPERQTRAAEEFLAGLQPMRKPTRRKPPKLISPG